MRTLALVGEGKGEVDALPTLAKRILHSESIHDWNVRQQIIRIQRGLLVDESVASPRRPPRTDGFKKAIALARAGGAEGLIILVDADDDCPVAFGPPAAEHFKSQIRGSAVMVVREFETWLILSHTPQELANAGIKNPENKRDAKKLLTKLVPGYLPTTHQLELTKRINVAALRKVSKSFDKFARDVVAATGPRAAS